MTDLPKLAPVRVAVLWLVRMSQRALLLEAHHTTHIEGTQLSIEQAEQLWAGRDVTGADKDHVREIHRHLFEGVRGDHALPGQWRTIHNYVASNKSGQVIDAPPPPAEVPSLMRELVPGPTDPTRQYSGQLLSWCSCARVRERPSQ